MRVGHVLFARQGRRSYDGAAARCSATEGRKNLRMNDVGMNLDFDKRMATAWRLVNECIAMVEVRLCCTWFTSSQKGV